MAGPGLDTVAGPSAGARRLPDPSACGLGMTPGEGLAMPNALPCKSSCHPEQREGSAQRRIPAGPPKTLVILSAAKDPACRATQDPCHPERSEGSGLPGHPSEPRSRASVARKILRPAASGRQQNRMPPERSCHPEQREGSAQRSIWPAGPPKTLVILSAAKDPACRATQDPCHPERSEGSVQRRIYPAGFSFRPTPCSPYPAPRTQHSRRQRGRRQRFLAIS